MGTGDRVAHGVEARAALPIGYGGLRDPLASPAPAAARALQLRGAARIPGVASPHAARGLPLPLPVLLRYATVWGLR